MRSEAEAIGQAFDEIMQQAHLPWPLAHTHTIMPTQYAHYARVRVRACAGERGMRRAWPSAPRYFSPL
jgi:hypothetical protein